MFKGKNTIIFVIIGMAVIIIGAIVFMNNKGATEKKTVLTYLENKYNEKFVINKLVSDNGEIGWNKAYVYPEGEKYNRFAVELENKDKVIGDGYAFIFIEKEILPKYEQWLSNHSLDARITIEVQNEEEITRKTHSKNVSYEEFYLDELPFWFNINIYFNDSELKNKDELLEKLSNAISDVPIKDGYNSFQIIFIKDKNYNNFDYKKYKGYEILEFKQYVKDMVANTQYEPKSGVNNIIQKEVLSQLKENFE